MRRALMVIAAAALGLEFLAAGAAATAGIVLSTTYPSIVVDRGKQVTFPVDVTNQTGAFQDVTLQIAEAPQGWGADLTDRGFSIREVMLKPNASQSVQFSAMPPAGAKPGDYAFAIRALSNGVTVSELRIAITLRDIVSSGLKLVTQYPDLQGQAGNTFSFTFDLTNEAGVERDIGMSARAPDGWQVTFKPQYDSKQVSSFRVKAGEKQSVDVSVEAPSKVQAGTYDVVIVATAGSDRAESPLKIAILGKGGLTLSTTDGRLNANATVDQDTKLSLRVKNSGTAPLANVRLSSSAPDGWTVTFQPATIDALAPDQQRDVTAVVHPGSRTLAGDYMLTLTASASAASDDKQIRVTVQTPTAWGIVGLIAIAAVLGGLGMVFARYSRR